MVGYRLYFMARGTEHIENVHEFEAIDDDAAISTCDEWRGFQTAELWSGDRKVLRWEGPGDSPRS